MKVICISGKAQHGKDTVAEMIKRRFKFTGKSILIIHYGDLVKFICEKYFFWNGEKDKYGRGLLQKVGTDVIRKQRPDYWVDSVIDILSFFPGNWDYVLIPDCRFPNEIDKMKEIFDTHSVRVIRLDFDNGLTPKQKEHPSETSLDNYEFDSIIVNSGTMDDLARAVNNWIGENME